MKLIKVYKVYHHADLTDLRNVCNYIATNEGFAKLLAIILTQAKGILKS